MSGKKAALPSVKISDGHVLIASGASVQLGAVCRINVNFAINAVPPEAAGIWLEDNKRYFTPEQARQLGEDFRSGYLGRGILGALGFVMGDGDYDRYQGAQDVVVQASSQEQASFVKALRTLSNDPMRLTSEIEIYGTSMMPSVAGVFARLVQIHFADGSSANFADLSDPVAADTTGEVRGVHAKKGNKLRMVPRN